MMNSTSCTTFRRPRVGLLAVTLELYETLAPKLRLSREAWLTEKVIPRLHQQVDVLFQKALFRKEDISSAVAEFERQGADVLLIICLTYSPSQWSIPALRRARLPIVIWNTQELAQVDSSFSIDDMIDNHGVHGTQDLANVLTRAGIPFHYVTSSWDSNEGLEELNDFFAASAAFHRIQSLRIGSIGYPFPGMGDFAVDTSHLISTLGCSWTNVSVEEYIQRSIAAKDSEVTQLVANYRDEYQVAADVTTADLQATARAEISLRGIVREHHLGALTYQFLAFGDDERTSTVPFVPASRLMAEGIGFGGEGDLIAAAATALFHWLNPPASFSEMFTIDFDGNSIFMSHMGEANVAMARRDRKVPLVARPTPITRTRDRQLALVASFEPGAATFAALTIGPSATWRIITAPVTILDYGPLPGFCVPHCKIQPKGNVRDFLTGYARAGGPHHNAICFGNAERRLRFLSFLLQAEFISI